ncbi:MAG: M23 family metallopeptidase [Clostridia bacterium]|nr:M23 family metallopeptidase [Clostridia bacterium]
MIIPFKCDTVRLTSAYGDRVLNGSRQFHGGYDLVGVGSYEVTAAVSGKVIRSRIITDKSNTTWQWGNYVCVRDKDGLDYYYCHLASRAVSEGDTVKAGDKLGIMGNTGYSFGAHLHFEVRRGTKKISPEEILGIPNVPGTYKLENYFEKDLDRLATAGIINSPDYWSARKDIDPHFASLIHKMAEFAQR